MDNLDPCPMEDEHESGPIKMWSSLSVKCENDVV